MKSLFDTFVGVAMEYDILAGGDPSLPDNKKYASSEARAADNAAQDEVDAVDSGEIKPSESLTRDDATTDQANGDNDTSTENEEPPTEDSEGNIDDLDDDGTGLDTNTADPAKDTTNTNRANILYQMITALHSGISANLDTLNHVDPPADKDASKIFFNVINHLTQCKDILYNIAIHELHKGEYVDILRKVTTVEKIYDLCIEATNKMYLAINNTDTLETLKEAEKDSIIK